MKEGLGGGGRSWKMESKRVRHQLNAADDLVLEFGSQKREIDRISRWRLDSGETNSMSRLGQREWKVDLKIKL